MTVRKIGKSYKVVTNYYLSLCNPYKQRAVFNTTDEWEKIYTLKTNKIGIP